MNLDDEIKTTRRDIISMIACAQDYGHDNQITADWFWTLLGQSLSDDEIAEYAASIAALDGYGDEDRDTITEALASWRDRQTGTGRG